MAGWQLTLDPTSEDATNVPAVLNDNAATFLLAHDYPVADLDTTLASSADTEGDPLVQNRPRNRQITVQLRAFGATPAALAAVLAPIQQKVAKINRDASLTGAGGTLQVSTPGGLTIVFDLLAATVSIPQDRRYVDSNIATVDLTFTAKPYGRGPQNGTITDSFASNTIANYTADAGATTNVSITGGVMQAAANLSTENRLILTSGVSYTDQYDAQHTVKINVGTTLSGFKAGIIVARVDAANYVEVYVTDNGTTSSLNVDKVVAGVRTNLQSTALTRITVSTSYWLRARDEGNNIYAEWWTAAPGNVQSPANAPAAVTLGGSDATTFGAGTKSKRGLVFTPQQAAASLDDFTIAPNTWLQTTLPAVIGTAYGVQGDAPALGKLILTNVDAAAIDQWWAIFGIQSRYTDQSASAALFWEAENLTAQGGSAVATRAGASPAGSASNNVMRNAALTTSYQSVLSTQATGGGAQMSHVGDYQVIARVYDPSATQGNIKLRLDWSVGDFRAHTLNAEVSAPVIGGFAVLDLGQVHIPKAVAGAQQWQGRVLAKTLDTTLTDAAIEIDCVALIPITEGSGRASAIQQFESPTSFSARDEFNQTAGALTGKAAAVGGVWAGAGSATDFSVETSGHTAQRAVSGDADDTTGRYMASGVAAFAAQLVQADVKISASAGAGSQRIGVLARYIDTNNWVLGGIRELGNFTMRLEVVKRVAGTITQLALLDTYLTVGSFAFGSFYTVRLAIDAAGRFFLWLGPQGATPPLILSGIDSALATGGALASGKPGIYGANSDLGTITHNIDNFIAAAATPDAAIFTGRTLEARHDRVIRQDSSGAFYNPVSKYEGGYLLVPPAGREGRAARVVAKTSRTDPTMMADSAIDDIQAQLVYTPRYLVVPE